MVEDSLSNEELGELAKRVYPLASKDIDELFFRLGWVDSEAKDGGNNSLPNKRLKYIKESLDHAQEWINNLFGETYFPETFQKNRADFLKILDEIEKRIM